MAIGLGKIMGFTFPENFNNPYISKSITEFWRRWHITSGAWMRDYLYIPLGGSRRGFFRNYANLWLVFIVSGLWHGAAWNFVAWGVFHGLFLVLDKLFLLKALNRIPKLIAILFTFIISMLGWVLFRIEDFSSAMDYYAVLFTGPMDFSQIAISSYQITVMLIAVFFSFVTVFKGGIKLELRSLKESLGIKQIAVKFATSLLLLAISIAWLTTSSFNPFIYFRF